MCQYPLFETIAIINGNPQRLEYHQKRYENAVKNYLKAEKYIDLRELLSTATYPKTGVVKCKIAYNATEYTIEISEYIPKAINKFQCVYPELAEYSFKYTNRELFNQFPNKKGEDIILVKQGYITDSSIGNLLFKKNEYWYSPHHYLLYGTQLDYLIDIGKVQLTDIHIDNLFGYEQIMLINALNPFNPQRALPINHKTILL